MPAIVHGLAALIVDLLLPILNPLLASNFVASPRAVGVLRLMLPVCGSAGAFDQYAPVPQ